jgi:hypothetical protein
MMLTTDNQHRALAGLSLVFDQENVNLIQVDSIDVKRSQQENVNSVGILYPGQRMDFVLRTSSTAQSPSSMMVQLDQGSDFSIRYWVSLANLL